MKIGNTTLIPQNVAPDGAQKVVICDTNGNVVCECELGNLALSDVGVKKYSVGLLSDTHTRESEYSTNTTLMTDSQNDLARAIKYFSGVAEITCVCGDLAEYNQALRKHKEIVDANKGEMKVFEIAGNHEHFVYPSGTESILSSDEIKQYTGYPLYYTISNQPTDEDKRNYYCDTVGDDVFIMVGAVRWSAVFNLESIQWLQETLDTNRNKRCFLFIHCFLKGAQYCGDSTGIINTVDMTATYKTVFVSLLNHYKNVIYFHGHSHVEGQMQEYTQSLANPLPANYDFSCGVHSVHIPSGTVPRDISSGSRVEMPGESQGYLMDVYDNHIVLRCRDFVKGEFIPIAHYCLDTSLKMVESKPASYFGL